MEGAVAGLVSAREMRAQEQAARATRGTPSPKIRDVSVIATQPGGVRLLVVKITTDQDERGWSSAIQGPS
jgi:mannonate dehydratase